MPRRDAVAHPKPRERPSGDARASRQDERVSLHGPTYQEVLAGLLKVDPKGVDEPEHDPEDA